MSTACRMRPGLKTWLFCNSDASIMRLQYTRSFRSMHIQRSHKFSPQYIGYKNRMYLRPTPQMRQIWIPPIWLRPLLRPLIIIIGGFLGGIIMQLWKGKPPQWLLTAESEGAAGASVGAGRYAGRIFGGSGLLIVLYLTRFRNPLYVSMIGATEAKLQLADGQASPQWNAMWDTHSANDSMKTRLTAMEKYLGEAMSASQPEKMSEVQLKVDEIRKKGYSNAVKVSLNRAEYWAESGRLVKFEQVLNTITQYVTEGGSLDEKELERVRVKAYGIHCGKLLADAQTFSNKGDVSKCQKQIADIRNIQYKMGGTFVEADKLEDVLSRAHQHHVSHMINEARKIRQNGSRKQAKLVVEQAKQYATLHSVVFDDNVANAVVN